MPFPKKESEELLSRTGRRCCICGTLHRVQLHHIVPKGDGGDDRIENAIPLCPNCHDEVHGSRAGGRTTRAYTPDELKLHLARTVQLVEKEKSWAPGMRPWEEDRALVLFYAQCLDRPAFRSPFHVEMSFSAFDQAMEDTLVALNTGFWRTRDGTVIERAKGKTYVTHTPWRDGLDEIARIIENIRSRFRQAVGFTKMPIDYRWRGPSDDLEELLEHTFRHDPRLAGWMDVERQKAVDLMNSLLAELGHPPLQGIRSG